LEYQKPINIVVIPSRLCQPVPVKKTISKSSTPSLVIIPEHPNHEALGAVPLAEQTDRLTKHPLAPHEHPDARGTGGNPGRAEIRRESPRVSAPRATQRTPERSNQPRTHKAPKK